MIQLARNLRHARERAHIGRRIGHGAAAAQEPQSDAGAATAAGGNGADPAYRGVTPADIYSRCKSSFRSSSRGNNS